MRSVFDPAKAPTLDPDLLHTNLPNNFHTPPPYHTLGNTGYKAPPDALPNTFLQRSSTSLQLLLRYSALLHKNPPNISVQPSSPTPIYNNLSNLFQDLSTQHFKNNLATTGFPAILHNTFCQQSKIPPFSETLGHVSTVPFPANLYNTLPQHFSAAAFSQPQPLHAVARQDPCTVIHAACLQLVAKGMKSEFHQSNLIASVRLRVPPGGGPHEAALGSNNIGHHRKTSSRR